MDLMLFKRMRHKFFDQSKALATNGTNVGHALVRLELMLLQLILSRVAEVTKVTGIRFLASMRSNVSFKVNRCREASRAISASVALFWRSFDMLVVYVSAETAWMRE
jgi:hypothetical protein